LVQLEAVDCHSCPSLIDFIPDRIHYKSSAHKVKSKEALE